MTFNRVILVGNVTRPAEIRQAKTGNQVATFTLAVNERRKDAEKEAHFFNCTAYGNQSEFIRKYVTTGSPILIEGRLRQERWEKEGKQQSAVKIAVDRVELLGRVEKSEETVSQKPKELVDYYHDGWEETEFSNQNQLDMELQETWKNEGNSLPF